MLKINFKGINIYLIINSINNFFSLKKFSRFLEEKVNFLKTDISMENKVRTEIIGIKIKFKTQIQN